VKNHFFSPLEREREERRRKRSFPVVKVIEKFKNRSEFLVEPFRGTKNIEAIRACVLILCKYLKSYEIQCHFKFITDFLKRCSALLKKYLYRLGKYSKDIGQKKTI
jgi:hypothetical protein